MKLRDILLEAQMSVSDALKIFGLTTADLGNNEKINSTYKKLAMQHHPDRGGDTAQMQQVTVAKSVLDKAPASGYGVGSRQWWDNTNDEYIALAKRINELIYDTYKPDVFVKYFEKVYGQNFTWKQTKEVPKKDDRSPNHAGFIGEFFNDDRTIVFLFEVSCYLPDVRKPGLSSGTDNISFPLWVTAYGVYANKKLKLSQRDWKSTNKHNVLFAPEETFPLKTLEKFKTKAQTSKFTRKDMVSSLTSYMQGKYYLEGVDVKLNQAIALRFDRTVLLRMGTWNVTLLSYKKKENGTYSMFSSPVKGQKYSTLMETIETLNAYKELYNKLKGVEDEAKALDIFNDWTEKYKYKG